ncbi:Peroxisomal membrane protein pex16, variant 2 [Orbilia oligospora]|uniref:Peroxisomal membrane protein PEX16 n=1 Tax=Orbilia oligospora TaxID=2813651 RepID=A0A6G1LUX2_ORBOL|nr:Peroxisomal membrane protein pex16, variant 2 [Orbilia oligospora]KAF3206067.1 Peroxisomal membrane protein pex16, variant 2 [Orbilia oligospora]KAF3208367.1 Peroxisomal membrane protein pex16, variant 2 [Orbilia oligospora]KAF3233821.1 Peroxisomal membrane protein pex16, variant 2 [Orbilia oligospora]
MDEHSQSDYSTNDSALSLPKKWLTLYEDFVTKNAGAVSQIESSLRSLTYIVPARFKDAEIASESIHSGIQLLSLYHDSLLSRAMKALPASIQRPPQTPHARYTRFWTQKSSAYKNIALMVTMIQYTELLWEMAARRKGQRIRWRVVVILEAIKAVCRLLLLHLTKSRPIVSPPLPEREVDPAQLEDADSISSPPPEPESWTMPRTGQRLPSIPATDIPNFLLTKVLTAEDIKPPAQLLHKLKGTGMIAEILWVVRPVLYAMAMQKWRHDKKSWRPWLIGFGLEYAARQLAKRDMSETIPGGLRGLTGLEKEELKRRAMSMGWWALRGAAYENVTRAWFTYVSEKLKDKPLIGLLGGLIEDYQYLWDNYYFSSM